MKLYKLKHDLPTFKAGDLFFMDNEGDLWLAKTNDSKHWKKQVMAYHHKTIERFPDILTDWFEEYEERDPLSKEAFIEYLRANPEERLMQAVCNFIYQELGQSVARLRAEFTGNPRPDDDTWNWECDKMLLEARQQEIKEPKLTTFEDIEKRKQMKNQLREWAENNDVTWVKVYFGRYAGTCDEYVRFRKREDFYTHIEIRGWPRAGLKECEDYSIEYLLDKVNKE